MGGLASITGKLKPIYEEKAAKQRRKQARASRASLKHWAMKKANIEAGKKPKLKDHINAMDTGQQFTVAPPTETKYYAATPRKKHIKGGLRDTPMTP